MMNEWVNTIWTESIVETGNSSENFISEGKKDHWAQNNRFFSLTEI